MKEKMIKKFDNKKLLEEICDAYGYDLKYDKDLVLCVDDEESKYTYESVELSLVGWLDTLIESELEYRKDNVDITWRKEIDYIKSIKSKLLFNKDSKTLEEALVYGKIPEYIKENLSVFLDEQVEKVNNFINKARENNFNMKVIKASLPVEFTIKEDEVKYIKIANKSFLERLVFEGDTSEIEFYEKDTYDKKGSVENIPLFPMFVSKFILEVPVAITIINDCLRIQTPIKYINLF